MLASTSKLLTILAFFLQKSCLIEKRGKKTWNSDNVLYVTV